MSSKLSAALLAAMLFLCCSQLGQAAENGSLVSRSPLPGAPAGSTAWRVRYRSTAQDRSAIEITGVVIIPDGPPPKGGRNVVAWAHGTVGIAEACAPSNLPKLFENIGGLAGLLAAGDVVTASDYQGLGTPGPSPFLVGVSSGRGVLDAVRAARAIPEAAASDRVVIWGESQGAHAAMWAGQIAQSYAPELHVLGVVAAAPPTMLADNFKQTTDTVAHVLLTAFTTQAYANVYSIKLATFANGLGQELIGRLSKDCMHVNTVDGVANIGMLLVSNQVPSHVSDEWGRLLSENTPQLIKAGSIPLMIVQGRKDVVIVPKVTREFALRSCQAGGTLTYLDVQGGDHTGIIVQSQDATFPWIADRFAGKKAPTNCGSF